MRVALAFTLVALVAAAGRPITADEVEGMERFRGSEEARRMLLEQGFVVTDETYRNICSFYDDENAPFFITTDSALFAYNVILEDALRKLECKQAERLKALTAGYLKQLDTYKDDRPEWRRAAEDLRAYFLVADTLAAGETSPEETKSLPAAARDEVALVLEGNAPATSPLRDIPLNYARFQPTGFYAEDDTLAAYYRAYAWLTAVPFRIADDHETRQAFLLGSLTNEELEGLLKDLQYPYWEFAGAEPGHDTLHDNPTIFTYLKALEGTEWLFKTPNINPEDWSSVFDYFKNEIDKYPDPEYTTVPAGGAVDNPADYKGLRLFADVPDLDYNALMLVSPNNLLRDLPRGEEYMALLGSNAARDIVMAREGKAIHDYKAIYVNAEQRFAELAEKHRGLLWKKRLDVYRDLLNTPDDPSLPWYYLEPAWRYKDLNTSLSGWAKQRYILNLHSDMGLIKMYQSLIPPPAHIEPNKPFFDDLFMLAVYTDSLFREYGVADTHFEALTEILGLLTDSLEKQLRGEPFVESERWYLLGYGSMLARACGYEWPGQLPDTPFFVSVLADTYTKNERLVGQTRPRKIYVLCEYDGQTYLTVGGVMTYADHVGPAWGPGKMDNDEWKARAAKGEIQPPAWEKAFYVAGAKKQQHLEVDYAPFIGDEQISGKP